MCHNHIVGRLWQCLIVHEGWRFINRMFLGSSRVFALGGMSQSMGEVSQDYVRTILPGSSTFEDGIRTTRTFSLTRASQIQMIRSFIIGHNDSPPRILPEERPVSVPFMPALSTPTNTGDEMMDSNERIRR